MGKREREREIAWKGGRKKERGENKAKRKWDKVRKISNKYR